MDQGECVLRPQGVEAASGGRDGSGLQDTVVIVPSGTADGDSAVVAGPADGPDDLRRAGPSAWRRATVPVGQSNRGAGAELVQAAWDAPCYHPSLAAWQNGQRPAPGRQYLPTIGHRRVKLGNLATATRIEECEPGGRKARRAHTPLTLLRRDHLVANMPFLNECVGVDGHFPRRYAAVKVNLRLRRRLRFLPASRSR